MAKKQMCGEQGCENIATTFIEKTELGFVFRYSFCSDHKGLAGDYL